MKELLIYHHRDEFFFRALIAFFVFVCFGAFMGEVLFFNLSA